MVRLVGNGDDHAMTAQDEDALVGCAGRPCSICRQVGEAAIYVAAEARGVSAAGMRRCKCVVHPPRRQQAFAVLDAILHVQHTEFRVIAQRGKA